jgi:hypothetical protein
MNREEAYVERVIEKNCELLNPGELEGTALKLLTILLNGTYTENQ